MNVQPLLQKVFSEMGLPAPSHLSPCGGGDTAISGSVTALGQHYFIKIHECADVLQAEKDGLRALSAHVRVPRVDYCGAVDRVGVLIMEYLALHAPRDDRDWRAIGDTLARLHRDSVTRRGYGRFRDNYIGASPQANGTEHCWRRFFVERRLRPQLEIASDLPDTVIRQIEAIMARVDEWLPDQPDSVLLHGDLWAGNLGLSGSGDSCEPVFYDPACYHGDPQVDLAMLALFGRVPDSFYRAYQGELPDHQQRQRWRVYDLYHLLNHFNLFGAGYAASVARTAEQLLRH